MGDLNRVIFVGRLTRDPEVIKFQSGGQVANFGLAVCGRRYKDNQSGEWKEEPCFLDCKAFDSDKGRKLATTAEKHLAKGMQVCVEGHMVLEKWQDKQTGANRQQLRVVCDNIVLVQFKDRGQQGQESGQQSAGSDEGYGPTGGEPAYSEAPVDGEIPF